MTGTATGWVGIVMPIVTLVAMKPMQQFVWNKTVAYCSDVQLLTAL